MTLVWPWSLLGLGVVAAVAAWALLRPARRLVSVGSLSLWRQAVDAMDRTKQRRSRKAGAAWLCLLAGAIVAVAATARPVYRTSGRTRRVAFAVYPAAELAGERGADALRAAAGRLLDRLDDHDRVQVLLPVPLGAAEQWVAVSEARELLAGLKPLPVAVGDMVLPEASGDAQHVYHFGPAAGIEAAGENVTVIEIPTDLPPVTIDALGAAESPGERVQIFLSLKNHTDKQWRGGVFGQGYSASKGESSSGEDGVIQAADVVIAPGGRKNLILTGPAADAVQVEVRAAAGPLTGMGAKGYLVRRERVVRKVAIVGADEPMVRRFVRVEPMLELVGDGADADVIVANRTDPMAGKGALVIDGRSDPAGWRRGKELTTIQLADADVDSSDPVMRYVDLSVVAVRRLRPWIASGGASGKRLVSYKKDAIILRTAPAAKPRRVFIAFDLSGENTNFAATDAFVIFLANAMRWLAPGGRGTAVYEFASPVQAGPARGWEHITDAVPGEQGLLAWPGIYRSGAGRLEAVSVIGLRSGRPRASVAQALAGAPLPEPQFAAGGMEFWPMLVIIAMVFWLAGWALRTL